jgi:hypothetical protein
MWTEILNNLITMPRAEQVAVLQGMQQAAQHPDAEAWNTAFDPGSLYNAWTQLSFVRGIYQHNRQVIDNTLRGRKAWHVVEIGGGNGALWAGLLEQHSAGTLTLIDPNPQAHRAVSGRLPDHVDFQSVISKASDAEIPEADVIVCSLALHHEAGVSAAQRKTFGMDGDGKGEILRRCISALRLRTGVGVLNEADCYNEIDLAPGDPVLVDHFIDVYVRRTARAIAREIDQYGQDTALSAAWDAIIRNWCIAQVENAFLPLEERDVYELDAARWTSLLYEAGAHHVERRYTDRWNLFLQYVFG